MKNLPRALVALAATASLHAQMGTVSHDCDVDVYRVTDEIVVKNPPRFGTNIPWAYSFKPWSFSRFLNIWNENFAFEPFEIRHEVRVGGDQFGESTPTEFHWPWQRGVVGISQWGLYPSGMYDGGVIEIYREQEETFERIHRSRITEWFADRGEKGFDEGYVVWEDPIPAGVDPIKAGDILVFTKIADTTGITCENPVSIRKSDGFLARSSQDKVDWVYDRDTFCPEGGSTASMRIAINGAGPGAPEGMKHFYINQAGVPNGTGGAGRRSDMQFIEGHPYKLQIWLKGEREEQPVRVALGKFFDQTLTVGPQWQKFEFDLPEKQLDIPGVSGAVYPELFIGAESDGTFWVDNMLVYQSDLPPFGLLEYSANALKEYHPGQVRGWAGYAYRTMDAALGKGFASMGIFRGSRVDGSNGLTLPVCLDIAEYTGGDPWLPIWALSSEEELTLFMEYLGGGAGTPGGDLRIAHGHPKPYTEVFDHIYLECNNEAWNQPFNIAGSNQDPAMYGKVANRMFRIFENSPYYDDDLFTMVLNGSGIQPYRIKHYMTGEWMQEEKGLGWTFKALLNCPRAEAVDWGVYYGGADGLTVLGENDQELYQNQLLYNQRIAIPKIFGPALELKAELKETTGRELELGTYESGPGYPIPSPKHPFTQEGELMGKSLAMGILTLDAFMRQQEDGYFGMCYYNFSTGNNWASHMDMQNMVPYPSWLAVKLRNEHCKGDLVRVDPVEVKLMDYAQTSVEKMNWNNTQKVTRIIEASEDVPLTACYAYRDGDRYSLVLYNLSYDEPREVRVELPYQPSTQATAYVLTHEDPRATNRYEEQVTLQEVESNGFSNPFTLTIPPSSAYVIVNEAAH